MNSKSRKYFTPIEVASMPEAVEERLRNYFIQSNLKPGDPLPKENELAESLGVSRNVVREALSRFKMLGLIESRKKRGMVLTAPSLLNGFERVLHPTFLGEKNLLEIFEMRIVLELGLADLLFQRKTVEDIEELDKILKRKHRQSDMEKAILEEEVTFHGKLYEISKNDTLKGFQNLLVPIFKFVVDHPDILNDKQKSTTVKHEDLLEALKGDDVERFRMAMKEHLRPHIESLHAYKLGL